MTINDKTLQILDCTLRDGGYCNKWTFGADNINRIIEHLVNANVEIVECGFLTDKISDYSADITKYSDLAQLNQFLPEIETKQKYVVMVNYGEYDADSLPEACETSVDGIRVAFHKKDRYEALEFCKRIKEKGYMVFVQPMVSMNYTENEFVELVNIVNEIIPYAFYIVDSFGTMRRNDLLRYLDIAEHKLDDRTVLGFHSHNNFQSAFSNALCLISKNTTHNLIVDTSIYGMGRGAGNLNTELFLNELNYSYDASYAIKPLLQIMDEVLHKFYEENSWGYSLPNYLSAAHMVHPNYSIYLCEKNTLTLDAMDDILQMLDVEKATEFDCNYIEKIYVDYMSRGQLNEGHVEEFKNMMAGRKVLLIAPGRSAVVESEKIKIFIQKENPIVISINHEYMNGVTNFIFVSNMRRLKSIDKEVNKKMLISSNIKNNEFYAKFDYFSLINSSKDVKDNAGLMAIQLLINMGCEEVYLAGYDGYGYVSEDNYEEKDMALIMSEKQITQLNSGMKMVMADYKKKISLNYLTASRFE